jgi:hypothetical protein
LHDAIAAERLGVPAIGVMTERFASAAEMMARAIGMPGYEFAVIGHPISSASPEQLEAFAQETIRQARGLLLRP